MIMICPHFVLQRLHVIVFFVALFYNAVINWEKRILVLFITIEYVVSPAYYDSNRRVHLS